MGTSIRHGLIKIERCSTYDSGPQTRNKTLLASSPSSERSRVELFISFDSKRGRRLCGIGFHRTPKIWYHLDGAGRGDNIPRLTRDSSIVGLEIRPASRGIDPCSEGLSAARDPEVCDGVLSAPSTNNLILKASGCFSWKCWSVAVTIGGGNVAELLDECRRVKNGRLRTSEPGPPDSGRNTD